MFDNFIVLYRALINYINRLEFPFSNYFCVKQKLTKWLWKRSKMQKRLKDCDNYDNQNSDRQ